MMHSLRSNGSWSASGSHRFTLKSVESMIAVTTNHLELHTFKSIKPYLTHRKELRGFYLPAPFEASDESWYRYLIRDYIFIDGVRYLANCVSIVDKDTILVMVSSC